ncbi:hypothetical protein J437_LFUL003586 [Ladona fulva]|uniref:Generative cell specific-1/HAP2 domain-containing protein n=1 Tax=Ladona fulva TaxID=123851 RepID=A0A8K0NSN8_LADFU|nr:hypothetical protein J437_LFUL003586 [Ladona fulva]
MNLNMDIDVILTNFISIFFVCNLIAADQIFFKGIKSPSVEVRGVYLPCNQEHKRTGKVPTHNRNFNNHCSKKISISIKLINVGPSQIQKEFLVLNHVYDPIANATSQLLNPIVFKVNQEPITEVYDLKYLTRINGEAKEVIKQACSHSGSHPVCGSRHLRNHKVCNNLLDCCCTCPSTKTSKDSREVMKRSCQHQSNSTPFQHTKESILPNLETTRLLKKKKVEDLSGISDVQTGVSLHSRKKVDDTPSLKDQMANQGYDKSTYLAKVDKGKYKYKISKMQPYAVDKHKFFANYMSHGGDRSEIQQASKLQKDVQNIFLEGESHYHSERSDKNNPMHKEKYSFYKRGENIADEETNDHNSATHVLNQELYKKIPYNNDVAREIILEDSQHENKIKSEMNENKSGVKVSGEENVIPVKYYDENSLNLAKQVDGYAAFQNAIPQHQLNAFKEDDSQPSDAYRNEGENDRSSHTERLVLVPKGEKLSRINIGIEYEQPKGKDDVNIEQQNLPSDANRNSYARERKNKTCENMLELHCLTFSKLWYNVYEFKKPEIKHIVELEIFERHYSGESRSYWIDHTKGKILRVGSVDDSNKGGFGGSILYKILEREENQSLNASSQELLVPQLSNEIEIPGHPGISEGNPGEYLVLPKHLLSLDGSKCDSAGVGVKAFISSKDICKADQGSCFRNQPASLWQKDKVIFMNSLLNMAVPKIVI